MADHPGWLLLLVASVERYEDVHPKVGENEECLAAALLGVPAEVRAMAAGYAQARRDAAAVPEESVRATVPLHWMLAPPAAPGDTAPKACRAFYWATVGEPGGPCVVTGEHRDHRDEHGHEWSATR